MEATLLNKVCLNSTNPLEDEPDDQQEVICESDEQNEENVRISHSPLFPENELNRHIRTLN